MIIKWKPTFQNIEHSLPFLYICKLKILLKIYKKNNFIIRK
ncbi:hypothetical protein HMPREF1870_00010 [Bacteroidales bacterium KA00344]|nr:hypothetical protein HMPREF1870_00010 [Bacteroidales bacterium KA00344]